VDVGGGSGNLSIAAVRACPELRATVVDLPSVAKIASRFVAEAGVAERVSVVAADVTREPLTDTYDVAVLKGFVQTLSADEVRAALRNVAPAIEPGGVIYIMGRVLDDSRLSPVGAVAMNLVFINIFDGGQSYTEREHREWLAEAGFVEIVRERLPDGSDMMRAVKAH
jgi:cyclopropane fatty-acyl-phospholipid synthase-like methyltransferase